MKEQSSHDVAAAEQLKPPSQACMHPGSSLQQGTYSSITNAHAAPSSLPPLRKKEGHHPTPRAHVDAPAPKEVQCQW